ncbi:MAG: winged helix-turn-helix transcriptional regulator [Cytophagales bacterium]|nr:winged helix-turn-helix transcriptional regulator [Cytophagales bacterium]
MEKKKTLCYHVKASWHSISRMYNSYASEHHVTISTAYVLLYLDLEIGVPSTQIAPQLGMEPRSLTRVLKSLEEKKVILKKVDKVDKRQVLIYLTPEGKEQQRKAKKIVKSFNQLLEENIPSEDRETFLRVLMTINEIAENNHLNPPR